MKVKNDKIAIFMGGVLIDVIDGQEYWKSPDRIPNTHNASLGVFSYDKSWDWLMPVIEKINSLGKEYDFSILKSYVSCSVSAHGKYLKNYAFSHAEYILPDQTNIEAAWKLVVKFVEWYETNKA